MPPRPRWWNVLKEAQRQACVAVDFYNQPGTKRSFNDFVVHMHLAWQNLLHAVFQRDNINYIYRDKRGCPVKSDDEAKTWPLSKCLKHLFSDNDPLRRNIEFFIGLRDKIEHRHQDAFLVATAAQSQALVVNFESKLTSFFGSAQSLSSELRFPVFIQSLSPAGMAEQHRIRKKLPAKARSYISDFERQCYFEVLDSREYAYRLKLMPFTTGSRTEADLAVTFVNADDFIKRAELPGNEQSANVIVRDRDRPVALANELLASQATKKIAESLPYRFNQWHFTQLWKKHRIRPTKGELQCRTDERYCLYIRPTNTFVYTLEYVKRCINELDTSDKYKRFFSRPPNAKRSLII